MYAICIYKNAVCMIIVANKIEWNEIEYYMKFFIRKRKM